MSSQQNTTTGVTYGHNPATTEGTGLFGNNAATTTGNEPGLLESARQGVENMVERGKEMLGNAKQSIGNTYDSTKQSTGEAYDNTKQATQDHYESAKQSAQENKDSIAGALHGAKEGAQAGYESGEKPYVQKGVIASTKEGLENAGEKAKEVFGMDKTSTGAY